MRPVAGRHGRTRRRALNRFERARSLPLGLGSLAAVAVIAGSVAAGVSYGGHGPLVLDAFGTTAGFAIDQVHLEGQRETSESAILAALGIGPDSSLLTVDADAARANLVALPWIANATVRKTFPGTVVVKIEEKTPAAIWQHGRQIAVVDDNGDVLSDRLDPRFVDLPLVVGAEANQHLDDILGLLSDFPEIAVQTRAAVFVGSRRWDLVLANGIQVRLPADNARTALAVLIEIDGREDLFTRDVASIDVRLPDRIAILPTDGALERAKEGGSGKGRREASI